MPTDTVYGLHCCVYKPDSLERIYSLKARDRNKPCIVIIHHMEDLKNLGIFPDDQTLSLLHKLWPNPISVVLPAPDPSLDYLTRGTYSLAIRMPDQPQLQEILKQTGPLISTSANLSGEPPITSIPQAQQLFGDQVDFYVDAGERVASSSALIQITDQGVQILRSHPILETLSLTSL